MKQTGCWFTEQALHETGRLLTNRTCQTWIRETGDQRNRPDIKRGNINQLNRPDMKQTDCWFTEQTRHKTERLVINRTRNWETAHQQKIPDMKKRDFWSAKTKQTWNRQIADLQNRPYMKQADCWLTEHARHETERLVINRTDQSDCLAIEKNTVDMKQWDCWSRDNPAIQQRYCLREKKEARNRETVVL